MDYSIGLLDLFLVKLQVNPALQLRSKEEMARLRRLSSNSSVFLVPGYSYRE